MYRSAFYGMIVFILYSCSFNKTFHKPTKTDPFEELTYFEKDGDTTFIEYIETNQEIILRDNNLKVINHDYFIQNHSFLTTGGNRLNGWLLIPKNISPKATILHFHGSAGNLITHYQSISRLTEHGFQVFMFDYSGYGSSEGESSHNTIIEDGYSAIEYLNTQDQFRDLKTIIYGQSYGGYLAAIVGSNRQESIDGIVIEGAFSSLKEEARHKASVFGNFVKSGKQADEEIKNNHKPVLIIHSIEDSMVPIKLGKKIYVNANYPKEFYEIDGEHNSGLLNYSKEIANKIHKMIMGD
ncbi:MAG: alpha/beta fold hydrolase [Flavobacteriaceae bacterium]|nr:alpha/beta fold hydrolase [Flavobacteriaceae bacterium]